MVKHFFFLLFALGSYISIWPSEKYDNPIVFGNNRITLITPTLFRLEYAENANFIDSQTMFAYNDRSKHLLQDFKVKKIGYNRYEITTSALRMVYYCDNYPFGVQNFQAYYQINGKEKKFTIRNIQKKNLGGAISTLDRVSHTLPLDEGLLSRDGWYIIDDAGNDLLINDWISRRPATHVQDLYCFVYGNNYRAALSSLGAVSGNVPMTRKYMHGIWYCRFWNYTSQEYLDLINEYKKYDFPLDNVVFDMDWHMQNATVGTGHGSNRGWTGYTWNKKLIPDPVGLIKKIHDERITVSLNDHPHDGIRPHEESYKQFMSNMGANSKDIAAGKTILFDLGDSVYMKNFFKAAHGENEKKGVDFWWLDWQQDYLYKYIRGVSRTTSLSWVNKLYFDQSKRDGKRGAGYSRWSGFGNQRYPIYFSGDAVANWEVLSFEVNLTSTSGNAGCYFWAHDIGGFYGGNNPELYARWSQFGALSAALRVHSTKDAKLDRRPWKWGDMALQSIRKSYHLRAQLMPYVYSSVWETHQTMVPLSRAMYIDYSDDECSFNNPQQFMFGDLLLVAPITSPGKGKRKIGSQKVWFPKGNLWYDFFNSNVYCGGMEKVITKDIDEFPLFVKGGYLLPMQSYTQRPATTPLFELILRSYPGEDGCDNTFYLYEDDGISQKYETGHYSLTGLNYRRSGNKIFISIIPSRTNYEEQVKERSYVLELPCISIISGLNTNVGTVKIVAGKNMTRIYIGKQPINKEVCIEFKIK